MQTGWASFIVRGASKSPVVATFSGLEGLVRKAYYGAAVRFYRFLSKS